MAMSTASDNCFLLPWKGTENMLKSKAQGKPGNVPPLRFATSLMRMEKRLVAYWSKNPTA